MPQGHPRDFLDQARELISVAPTLQRPDPGRVAAIDQARAEREETLQGLAARTGLHHSILDPKTHSVELVALNLALFAAKDVRARVSCSHLACGTEDAQRVIVDLTHGLVSCGCDERVPPRADDGLCELCGRQAPGRHFRNAAIPSGAQWVFVGNFCDECAQWMVEISGKDAVA
jgi:hypothetical protein